MLVLLLAVVPRLTADTTEDRRAEAGVRVFRALLAADLDLEKKAVEGELLVVFFYTRDVRRAAELGASFQGDGDDPIRGMRLRVEASADPSFASYATPPAGIFLAQPVDRDRLRAIVAYGIAHHLVVYSPFEGDVEDGVLAGLSVEAQVRPYVNRATLAASGVSLKEFFLRVTRLYP